jgi:ribosomal protein S1
MKKAKPTDLMAKLLTKTPPKRIKKGEEVKAKIVSLSKKRALFDIGGKTFAVLGEKELPQLSLYLPYLKEGDEIKVNVVAEESRNGFPVVSLQKFFNKGKWEILAEKKEKEELIEVICGEYGKGGVFIDFMGIRGVIPTIQLTEPYINEPEKLEGQRIKVKILEVNKAKNRLVVSQKAAAKGISQKELKERFEKIKVGEKYQAKVLSVSEFGIFCEINGVEGLVHISEISWEKVTDPSSYASSGQTIDVIVVEKNEKDLKLNLSIKRLTPDPWQNIEEKYPKDKLIEGEVIRKEKYGYFVRLEAGIEGLIHISKLKGDEKIKIGEKIQVYIERINKKTRRLSLVLPPTKKPVLYR